MLMMLTSAAKITSRCRYTAIHLSGYRSSADIFLAPLERIDFLTYLHANDGCGPTLFSVFAPLFSVQVSSQVCRDSFGFI